MQEMAANRVQHAIMEARIPTAGNQWAAREFFGQSAALDQHAFRSFAEIHRATDRIDHSHGSPRIGQQMSKFDAHAARLFHRHAAARFLGNASLPDQAEIHVHLPVRGDLHGGFYEKDL